jgi:hypothetical protein
MKRRAQIQAVDEKEQNYHDAQKSFDISIISGTSVVGIRPLAFVAMTIILLRTQNFAGRPCLS